MSSHEAKKSDGADSQSKPKTYKDIVAVRFELVLFIFCHFFMLRSDGGSRGTDVAVLASILSDLRTCIRMATE